MPQPKKTADVVALPGDAKARRQRRLQSLWAKEDDLLRQLAEIRGRVRPLQGEVSLDRGYLFTVSRANLERDLRRDRT